MFTVTFYVYYKLVISFFSFLKSIHFPIDMGGGWYLQYSSQHLQVTCLYAILIWFRMLHCLYAKQASVHDYGIF